MSSVDRYRIHIHMAHVLGTVLSVFSIIILGYYLERKGVIRSEYIATANQIVFYIAIPAMLFNETAKAPFKTSFHLGAVLCLLAAVGMMALMALGVSRILGLPPHRRGTFAQSSFHGNLGYMAYAIAYYALGKDHFTITAILSSFMMVEQNLLAIWVLTAGEPERNRGGPGRLWDILVRVLRNPIILSVSAGIVYSTAAIPLPFPVEQFLRILSGMALPTALLLIGASLSFGTARAMGKEVFSIAIMKLICLPAIGYALMRMVHVPNELILAGIVLLASPSATVTYVMAVELGGDSELAAAGISVVTLASAFTYTFFLWMLV